MKHLELRRHATRDASADALSPAGRALAEDIGRAQDGVRYDAVFVSPAGRAAETAAWILRGAHQQLPPGHAVLAGLAGADASGGSPEGMAAGVRAMLLELPEGGRGLAISHTPFVERAAFGLTGREVEAMRPGEGVLVTERGDGVLEVEELRLPAGEG
ncbi:MAG TPA: histidine phosphatase family protein [Actinomycetota bacterium]|nr:histidine phosphatase family protein [Actinomycetota bacterium]